MSMETLIPNIQAPRYAALLDRPNTSPHAMTEATFEHICRVAWENLPESALWDDLPDEARDSYREDVRWVLNAAADTMPIETLHGADGASMWLRGEQ